VIDPGIAALIGASIATIGSIVVALIQARSTKPEDPPKIILPSGGIVSKSRPITWRTMAWIIAFALLGGIAGYLLGRVGLGSPTPTTTPSVVMSDMIAIQTYHKKGGKNRYVTAMDSAWDWVLRGETNELRASERFTLLCLDNDKVAFQTAQVQDGKNRYITAMGSDWDWVLRGEAIELLEFEQFMLHDVNKEPLPCLEVLELLKQGEVQVALQTCHKNNAGDKYRYVTAMNDEGDRDWKLVAQADDVQDWEKFTLVPLP
jgi:hypothetical protein